MVSAIITIVLAAVVTAVIWAAAAGRLSANGLVGIQATQRSESAWRVAHRAALRIVLPVSVVVVTLGVVALVAPSSDWNTESVGLVLLGIHTLALIASGVVAQRAARASSAA